MNEIRKCIPEIQISESLAKNIVESGYIRLPKREEPKNLAVQFDEQVPRTKRAATEVQIRTLLRNSQQVFEAPPGP
jgi:hypothetical protein